MVPSALRHRNYPQLTRVAPSGDCDDNFGSVMVCLKIGMAVFTGNIWKNNDRPLRIEGNQPTELPFNKENTDEPWNLREPT